MYRNVMRGCAAASVLLIALSGVARADQSFGVTVGYFAVRGEDARIDQDVLLANRNFLTFEFKDFSYATFGGEYLVGLGDFLEVGVGVGYYRRTVPTVYTQFVHADGSEIEQDLKLRIVPIAATVRVVFLGRSSDVQPYVGGGVGLFNWRYSETGEFLDPFDGSIFRARFVQDGREIGPVILAGIRGGPTGSSFMVGGEVRYQAAKGRLDPANFLSDRIDLGGYTAQATFHVRF